MKRLLLCLLIVTGSAQSNDDPGKGLVDAFIHDVQTFSGNFQQSLLDPDGEIIDETRGTLEIKRPGQFRWDSIEPYEQWLIADGLNIWSYDVDLAQVTVKPQSEALSNTPALILSGAATALEQFNYIESYQEEESAYTWVRLAPVSQDSGFKRMELGFLDNVLHRMVFFDNLEQTTLVQLSAVRVNAELDPARFEFQVPDDVDVVGTPASPD